MSKENTEAQIQEQTQWLSHAELESYATMARKEHLSVDDMFGLFDKDEEGYHFNGIRCNAKILTGMYYAVGRRLEMQERLARVKAEAKRQGE